MKVIFVMGMSGAGKSTFIKENFKDYKVLDLLDFQKELWPTHVFPSIDLIWESYVNLKNAMITYIKDGQDIVIEHTLLKAKRRSFYLEELKEKNVEVIGYYLDISKEEYEKRNNCYGFGNFENSKEIQEIPKKEEGFDELHIINQ